VALTATKNLPRETEMGTPKLRTDKGAWVITFTWNGAQIRHYPGYASEEKCKLILNAIAADIELGTYDVSRDRYRKQGKKKHVEVITPYPSAVLSKYMAEGGLKPSTLHAYEIAYKALKSLKKSCGDSVLNALQQQGFKASTIVRLIGCVSAAYSFCGIKWDKPQLPKSTATNNNSEAHWLAPAEIRAMLAWAEGRHNWQRYIQMALETGARPGEIIALADSDYDPLAGMLAISKNVTEVNGRQVFNDSTKTSNHRGGGSRVLPVNSRLAELLPGDKPVAGELLLKPYSDKKYFCYRTFRLAFCKAFPGRTPYNFRDTFIFEQLFVHHVNIDVVAAWVGNTPEMIRKSYLNRKQVAMLQKPG
jgi:hypothetical protein